MCTSHFLTHSKLRLYSAGCVKRGTSYPNPSPNLIPKVEADGVDNGCHIVAAAEKPKRPYPDPSVLLAIFKFKLILFNPNPSLRMSLMLRPNPNLSRNVASELNE